MAALASSLIRQKREVREPGSSRPVSAQRRVCPRGTKSLCQKQLLILLSKVRLCGGRPARQDRGPGECVARAGSPSPKSFCLRPGTLENAADPRVVGGGCPKSRRGGPERPEKKKPYGTLLQFPSPLPVTPSLLAFEGKGTV